MLSHFQTEKHIQEYNKMARKLKLIPSTAEHANGIDFEMHFNPHTQRPDQRTHVDFKGTIKVLSVLTEIESCLLIGFFFLLLLLGSRNARMSVVFCTSSSHILFVQLIIFNYKMTELGQVSLYSFLSSLGPGTVMGENGGKKGWKSKTKGERSDLSGGMSPFPSQTPSCPFFLPLRSLISGYFLPSKKINFSRTIASLFEPCSCVFWNEGMFKTNPASDKINSCSLKLQLIATTFVNCSQICQNLNSCGLWYWKFHVLAKEIHLKSAMQIQSFCFVFVGPNVPETFSTRANGWQKWSQIVGNDFGGAKANHWTENSSVYCKSNETEIFSEKFLKILVSL